jgi:hypothetical protein
MKTKPFDCVEMKRNAAERIYEETKNLTLDERIQYWQHKNDDLFRKHQKRNAAKKSSPL